MIAPLDEPFSHYVALVGHRLAVDVAEIRECLDILDDPAAATQTRICACRALERATTAMLVFLVSERHSAAIILRDLGEGQDAFVDE